MFVLAVSVTAALDPCSVLHPCPRPLPSPEQGLALLPFTFFPDPDASAATGAAAAALTAPGPGPHAIFRFLQKKHAIRGRRAAGAGTTGGPFAAAALTIGGVSTSRMTQLLVSGAHVGPGSAPLPRDRGYEPNMPKMGVGLAGKVDEPGEMAARRVG